MLSGMYLESLTPDKNWIYREPADVQVNRLWENDGCYLYLDSSVQKIGAPTCQGNSSSSSFTGSTMAFISGLGSSEILGLSSSSFSSAVSKSASSYNGIRQRARVCGRGREQWEAGMAGISHQIISTIRVMNAKGLRLVKWEKKLDSDMINWCNYLDL